MIVSVNLAVPEVSAAKDEGLTGINKVPATGPVLVYSPQGKTSGVEGDRVFASVHGGLDQAVYAYAREDYDWWQEELGRDLPGGLFGENLTTLGVDVNGAIVGERWHVGAGVVLQPTLPRIPCNTFQAKMGEPQWTKRFTKVARPGSYLRVVEPGAIQAGDKVSVADRPAHGITIEFVFRALTLEPELLPLLASTEELPESVKAKARKRLGIQPAV